MTGGGAAIVGIAHTEFMSASGKSDLALTVEAIRAAITDAGLSMSDIDGLVTLQADASQPTAVSTALALGPLSWYSSLPYGGGACCGSVQDAALAISAGLADVIVIYRGANLRSGARFGRPGGPNAAPAPQSWGLTKSYGLVTPAISSSLVFHRWMYEHGLTNEDLAVVACTNRDYGSTNPRAHFFSKPLTVEDYHASRWVVEPVLRVADCCLETDAGAAIVVAREDIARSLTKRPATVRAAARGMGPGSSVLQSYYRDDMLALPDLQAVAAQLWAQSTLGANDIDVAMLYDNFSPVIPMVLESFGFSEPGKGCAFIAEGNTRIDGRLPVNTNGGMMSEAYVHGFNGMIEAVRQIRGESANQVANVDNVLVTGGTAQPTSGMILQGGT
ncbi:thiolase C-terminal domain-containing protein [Nocardia vaccinii]|uniref:thiolase C-terminal domain-containing protein n=1 Tax=Nocardia vaccinii TaxID=1822 RepID=UPI00082E9390|nr:hypothetical protein [Nocardia vaccinii]